MDLYQAQSNWENQGQLSLFFFLSKNIADLELLLSHYRGRLTLLSIKSSDPQSIAVQGFSLTLYLAPVELILQS